MTQSRAEKRRLDKLAKKNKDGEQPEDPNAEIDAWLLPDEVVPGQPLPLHRIQIALGEYQRANNTRWMSRGHLKLGNDLNDESMRSEARANGRRARAILDQAITDIQEAWLELSSSERDDLVDSLPVEIVATFIAEQPENGVDNSTDDEGPD